MESRFKAVSTTRVFPNLGKKTRRLLRPRAVKPRYSPDFILVIAGLLQSLQDKREGTVRGANEPVSISVSEMVSSTLDKKASARFSVPAQRSCRDSNDRGPESMAAIFARLAEQGNHPVQGLHHLDHGTSTGGLLPNSSQQDWGRASDA